MKTIKRIAAICIAVLMVIAMTAAASAQTDPIADVQGHDFNAYQVLAAQGSDGELVKLTWGSAIANAAAQTAFLNALKASDKFVVEGANIFASVTDPESLARVLENYQDDSDIAKAFAAVAFANIRDNNGSSFGTFKDGESLGEAGYYLFEDASGSDVSVVNPVIIRMAADSKVDIQVKTSVPHVEKKVKENTYNVNYTSKTITAEVDGDTIGLQYGTGYNDAADYNIGDLVPFELIGTVAGNISDYTTYYYAFIDSLSKGLTYDANKADVKVSLFDIKNGSYAKVADVTSFFTPTPVATNDGTQITFACNNLLATNFPKVTPTSLIIVNYNAELNADAVIGLDGNPNEVYLEYSNRPENSESTGTTEEDVVVVFTYAIRFVKNDGYDNAGLKDAKFTLQNSDGKYYVASATGTRWTNNASAATQLTSDANGVFLVKGLDKGTYTLTETEAPADYKPLDGAITFTLNAKILPDLNNDDNAQLYLESADIDSPAKAFIANEFGLTILTNPDNAAVSATLTPAEKNAATATMSIINIKRYTLPGTGGVGTVMLYACGFMLVIAGLFVLVRKIRAK